MQEISVRKQGEVYTVFMDGSRVIPIQTWDSEPAGFPSTFFGLGELKAAFPGANFRFLEPPKRPENTGPRDAAAAAAASARVRELGLTESIVPVVSQERPLQNTTTTAPNSQGLNGASTLPQRAQEFLKRLEVAREYASAKNRKELDIKISAVQELIKEVFG